MDVRQAYAGGGAFKFKIGRQILFRKDVSQRFSPDDSAFTAGVFKDGGPIAFSSKFIGNGFYLHVAIRIMGETR
jgi:hypothetical protein